MSKRRSNRFSPSFQVLDDRTVPSVVVTQAGSELNFLGDSQDDTIYLRDDGAGNITYQATGAGFGIVAGITKITVNTEGGNDYVQYDLNASLQPGQQQYVLVGLGSNYDPTSQHDTFVANLRSGIDIMEKARLDVIAMGGFGDDNVTVNASGVNVRQGGILKTQISGGFGNDTVTSHYDGIVDGSMTMRSHGGDGTDSVIQTMTVEKGSHGAVAGLVTGGDGNDTLVFFLSVPVDDVKVVAADLYGNDGADILYWSLDTVIAHPDN